MDKLIYTAASGAQQNLAAQAIYANNLSNIDTPGFRSDYATAQSVYLSSRAVNTNVLVKNDVSGSQFQPGNLITTNRDLDVAIRGDGFVSVLDASGKEAYTRAGNLTVDSEGVLKTQSGYRILGNSGAITIPDYEKITVGSDGTLSVRPLGSQANALVQVDQLKLVNPDVTNLVKGNDGLFRSRQGASLPASDNVELVSGALETSNVNAVDSLLSIMNLSRQFELQMKEIKQSSDLDEQSNQLLKIG